MAKKKAYRGLLYGLARLVSWGLWILPRKTALRLARIAGYLAFWIVTRQRRSIIENLRLAFGDEKPEAERQAIAKQVFSHMAQTIVETVCAPKLSLKKIESFVEIGETYEVYEKLLKEGKGLISITAHIGNWELLAGLIGLKGFPGFVVARRIYYEPYNRWIVGLRTAMKLRTVYRDDSARQLLELLKKNQIVGILPDQDIEGVPGVFVDFFGRPAYTPVAPVKLALATGAPILANFLVREPEDRYRLVLGKVIRPAVETTREEAVQKYTAIWMLEFEKIIRAYPEQWAWMHPRWKTTPDRMEEPIEMELKKTW